MTKEKAQHLQRTLDTELDKYINGKSRYINAFLRDLYLILNHENFNSSEEALHYLRQLRKERQVCKETHLSKETKLNDLHEGDISEFPEHLKIREMPHGFKTPEKIEIIKELNKN